MSARRKRLRNGVNLLIFVCVGIAAWIMISEYNMNQLPDNPESEGPVALTVQQNTPCPTPTAMSTEVIFPPTTEEGWQISSELTRAQPLQICVGETVAWRNRQPKTPIILTAEDGSFSSGVVAPGAEFARMFSTPGVITVAVTAVNGEVALEPWTVEVTRCEN